MRDPSIGIIECALSAQASSIGEIDKSFCRLLVDLRGVRPADRIR
jgi:hypothetical protein